MTSLLKALFIVSSLMITASNLQAQTDRELAIFSSNVYDGGGGVSVDGWTLVQFAQHSGGYAGALLRSEDGTRFVFVHRGTDGTTDLSTDYTLFREDLPSQFYLAEEFVRAAATTHNVPAGSVTHTGHSLGGFLAETLAADATTPGSRSVTFDNPGTKPILDKYPRFVQPVDSRGYLAAPHLLNTANRQATDDLVRIYPAFSPPTGVLLENPTLAMAHYTAQQHRITGMVSTFDTETGMPFFSTSVSAADWPVGPNAALAHYSSYSTNSIYWDMATRAMPESEARAFIDSELGGLSGQPFRPPSHTLGNTQDGLGMSVWPINQGYYEQGQYQNGVSSGRVVQFPTGMDLVRFGGDFENGRPISGRASYSNGDSANGEFSGGALNGEATYTFRSTDTEHESVTGSFTNHMLTNGLLSFRNGDTYDGEFITNQESGEAEPIGQGTLTTNNHEVSGVFSESGNFSGTVTFSDGSRYEGAMLAGKRHGNGTQTFADGLSISGDWRNDQRNGTMRFNLKDGYYQIVQYADGNQIGPVIHHRPDGSVITRQQISANNSLNWWVSGLGNDWYGGDGGTLPVLPPLQLGIRFN